MGGAPRAAHSFGGYTMTIMHDGMLDALESLIDKHGMVNIMLGLVHICDEKAEHVESNWQDLELASAWRKVSDALIGKRLSNALNRLPGKGWRPAHQERVISISDKEVIE
jgi:hypothetical protein